MMMADPADPGRQRTRARRFYKKCPICKLKFWMQKHQVTCSRQCAGIWTTQHQDDVIRHERSRKAGLAGGAVRRAKRDASFQRYLDADPPLVAVQKAYKNGYNAGIKSRMYYELRDLRMEHAARRRAEHAAREVLQHESALRTGSSNGADGEGVVPGETASEPGSSGQ